MTAFRGIKFNPKHFFHLNVRITKDSVLITINPLDTIFDMNRKSHSYYIYITASISRVLYIGMTGNLYLRILKHKRGIDKDSFTSRYHVNRLVYFEEYKYVNDAIDREKQLKKWRRQKKIGLIESINPKWCDLFYELDRVE